MKRLVIFLNELSCTSDPTITPSDMAPHLLATLQALRAAKAIRKDIIVAAGMRLVGIPLGDGTHTLATALRGSEYIEERRFVMNLEQSSPWGAYPNLVLPGQFQEVSYNQNPAVGMLWAKQNESAVFSFAFPPHWGNSHIDASFLELNEDGNGTPTDVSIANLSRPEHAQFHSTLIRNYGGTLARSALIYEEAGFVVRMYFNDHPPPHFHVLERQNTSETLATCRIDTLDVLAGELSSNLTRRVRDWAGPRKADLMTNWERCRTGQHPFVLDGQ